jgi:hypothetical protein
MSFNQKEFGEKLNLKKQELDNGQSFLIKIYLKNYL